MFWDSEVNLGLRAVAMVYAHTWTHSHANTCAGHPSAHTSHYNRFHDECVLEPLSQLSDIMCAQCAPTWSWVLHNLLMRTENIQQLPRACNLRVRA